MKEETLKIIIKRIKLVIEHWQNLADKNKTYIEYWNELRNKIEGLKISLKIIEQEIEEEKEKGDE